MGNTPSGSSTTQLGKSASMAVRRSHGNGYLGAESYNQEEHSATFHVDDRTTVSSIRKFKRPSSSNRVERFVITITDSDQKVKSWRVWPYKFEMVVETTQQNQQHLKVTHAKTGIIQDVDVLWLFVASKYLGGVTNPLNLYDKNAMDNPIKTIAADGSVTFTYLNFYRVQGNDKQKGLVVIEVKKMSSMEHSPIFEVIVSHYFATLGRTEAGFSVAARMRGGGGEDSLQLEGSIIHPARDLFEMFGKVLKNGHWTPNLCPHCANSKASVGASATKGRDMRLHNKPKGLETLFMGNNGAEFPGKLQISESESEDSDEDDDSEATTSKVESTTRDHKKIVRKTVKHYHGIVVYQ